MRRQRSAVRGACRWVVRVGHAEQEPRARGFAGRLEGVRIETFVVDPDGQQLEAEQPREVLEARIGQRLDHHRVARSRQRADRHRERLLRAGGQDDAFGIGGDPASPGPLRENLAVMRVALGRTVVEQDARVGLALDVGEHAAQGTGEFDRGRAVKAEVDLGIPGRRRWRGNRARSFGDETAAPDVHDDRSAPFGKTIGAVDRTRGDAQRLGEIAHRRQPRAGRQAVGPPVGFNGVGDLAVDRPGVVRDRRMPHCYENNIVIDMII